MYPSMGFTMEGLYRVAGNQRPRQAYIREIRALDVAEEKQ